MVKMQTGLLGVQGSWPVKAFEVDELSVLRSAHCYVSACANWVSIHQTHITSFPVIVEPVFTVVPFF